MIAIFILTANCQKLMTDLSCFICLTKLNFIVLISIINHFKTVNNESVTIIVEKDHGKLKGVFTMKLRTMGVILAGAACLFFHTAGVMQAIRISRYYDGYRSSSETGWYGEPRK